MRFFLQQSLDFLVQELELFLPRVDLLVLLQDVLLPQQLRPHHGLRLLLRGARPRRRHRCRRRQRDQLSRRDDRRGAHLKDRTWFLEINNTIAIIKFMKKNNWFLTEKLRSPSTLGVDGIWGLSPVKKCPKESVLATLGIGVPRRLRSEFSWREEGFGTVWETSTGEG